MELDVAVGTLVGRERDTLFDQPFDTLAAALHDELDNRRIAQAAADRNRVANVRIDGIGLIDDGGYAALRIQRRAFFDRRLGDHGNPEFIRKLERDT